MNQLQQDEHQESINVTKLYTRYLKGPVHSLRFPRLGNLVNDVLDPSRKFMVIVGAGISVAAGLSAYRSHRSIFKSVSKQYVSWPNKDDTFDSFLRYAFSITALKLNPRVQYRVLYFFNSAIKDSVIKPTKTHIFLQYLAENGKLTSVITQNIDDLELDVGLSTILDDFVIQAHGSLKKHPICINFDCPVNTIDKAHADGHQLHNKYQKCAHDGHPSIFENTSQSVFYNEDMVQNAIQDNSVPCCMFCGCAIKPGMVLYEEDIQINAKQMKQVNQDSNSVLVIGTSLNVEPVSHIPAYCSHQAPVHIISKHINFYKFLREKDKAGTMLELMITRRYNNIAYQNGDYYLQRLNAILAPRQKQGDYKIPNEVEVLNSITPLFNYHKGACDELVEEVVRHLPGCKEHMDRIQQKVDMQTRAVRRHRFIINVQEQCITLISSGQKVAFMKVFNPINLLFQPDCVLYYINGRPHNLLLCTQDQISLILSRFDDVALKAYPDTSSNPLNKSGQFYILTNYNRKMLGYYKPLYCHYSSYCIAYNAYKIKCKTYIQEYDPWSSNYIFNQRFHEQDQLFRYYNIEKQFQLTKTNLGGLMHEYLKCCSEYQCISEQDMVIMINE